MSPDSVMPGGTTDNGAARPTTPRSGVRVEQPPVIDCTRRGESRATVGAQSNVTAGIIDAGSDTHKTIMAADA